MWGVLLKSFVPQTYRPDCPFPNTSFIPLYDRSLKLMAVLMKGDNTTACLELAEGLHTVAALEGAIKLATHFRSVGGLG